LNFIKSNSIYLVTVVAFLISCEPNNPGGSFKTDPLYITITEDQHHLGDNESSEGSEYAAHFDVQFSYEIAILSITFKFPNEHKQSGPKIDSPPEIYLNDKKIGLLSSDFLDSAECISTNREYECDITIFRNVKEQIKTGNNSIRIVSNSSLHNGEDDFVFKDLKIELSDNNI